jgi:hypothetical protein
MTDEMGELVVVRAGDMVSFSHGERHRLVGSQNTLTLVAEVWRHTDPLESSDEEDIIRLQDDYNRA